LTILSRGLRLFFSQISKIFEVLFRHIAQHFAENAKSGQTAVVCPPDVGKRSDKIILLYKQKDQEQQAGCRLLRQWNLQ